MDKLLSMKKSLMEQVLADDLKLHQWIKINADHLKNIEDRENNMDIDQRIGTNENLKLRLEKDKIKE